MDRRQFVCTASSTVVVGGLAGCLHGEGDGDFGSPTAVVEAFFQAIYDVPEDASGEERLEEFDEYLHSESPWRDAWADRSADEFQGDGRTVDSVEAEVIEADLSAEEIQEKFSEVFFELSDETIDTLADDNAVVEATITYEEASEVTVEPFTAPEGGNWQVFF